MALRIGIIGLGRAARLMIPALAAHPNVQLAAAADPNAAARSRFETDFGGPTYLGAEALCESRNIDAVYIATPHERHAPDTLTALRYGKHVMVEKPMALTVDDCVRMTEAATAANRVLIVGHTHAFDATTVLMRNLVHSGEFGRLRSIVNIAYTNFLYRPRRPVELDSALGGGIMYNQVPHQVEILRMIGTSPIQSVRAVSGIWDSKRMTEGALSALLLFEDGAVAQIAYSGYDHFDSDELHYWIGENGEQKALGKHSTARRALREIAGTATEADLRAASGYGASGIQKMNEQLHEGHFGFLLASCERADLRPAPDGVTIYGDEGIREVSLPRPRVYPNKDNVIDEFYEAIVHGRPAIHDGAWGTTTMKVALALVESARQGREVTLS